MLLIATRWQQGMRGVVLGLHQQLDLEAHLTVTSLP
jgi:hypothetical protein